MLDEEVFVVVNVNLRELVVQDLWGKNLQGNERLLYGVIGDQHSTVEIGLVAKHSIYKRTAGNFEPCLADIGLAVCASISFPRSSANQPKLS